MLNSPIENAEASIDGVKIFPAVRGLYMIERSRNSRIKTGASILTQAIRQSFIFSEISFCTSTYLPPFSVIILGLSKL